MIYYLNHKYQMKDTNNNRILELFENCDFENIKIPENIETKLLDYQILHVQNLIYSLENNNILLDLSDTGCGKTYSAIAVCKFNQLRPMIICPKTIISSWKKVCKYFQVKPYFVVNYETMRNGKYYKNGERIFCPCITIHNASQKKGKTKTKSLKYTWNMPNDAIFIFDEVHNCRSNNSLNSKLLQSIKPYKALLLSATLTDKIKQFNVFSYVLGFTNNIKNGIKWVADITQNFTSMKELHDKIYPNYASRISIKELGDKFPSNQIVADTYNGDNYQEVNKLYENIKQSLLELKSKKIKDKQNSLVKILRARQSIELLKSHIILNLVGEYQQNGYSVVIFVNFTNTLKLLCNELKTTCCIYGKQTLEQRENNIELFQKNKEKIIVCNISAGGQSISLHDTDGNHPRVSFILPSFSSIELVQALGRIHRANGKSPALQRIIFYADTVEEFICQNINKKLNIISELNDGDMNYFEIEGIEDFLNKKNTENTENTENN